MIMTLVLLMTLLNGRESKVIRVSKNNAPLCWRCSFLNFAGDSLQRLK